MPGRRVGTGLVIVGTAAALYFRFLRQWHLHWGAAAQEVSGEVAGDELMPHPDIVATRVVEIDAPPSAIWPWLVQMGPGRGGAYTYDWIERRLGIDIRNTDRVIPELQHLKVGDEIPMPGYAMRVERLDPGQAMVVRSSNHAWVWIGAEVHSLALYSHNLPFCQRYNHNANKTLRSRAQVARLDGPPRLRIQIVDGPWAKGYAG